VIVTVWIVWEIMLNSALFLDVVYWALLADRDDVENPEFLNWMVHFGNFIVALIDFSINRISLVPMHFLFVYLYPLLYMIFAWIWFAARGEWIYGFVNLLVAPLQVLQSYVGVILIVGASFFVLWCLDRIKRCLCGYGINDHANDGIMALADGDALSSCSISDSEDKIKLDLFSRAGVVASDAALKPVDQSDDPDKVATKKHKKSKKGRRHH
jgi:hypothetical protein